MPVPVSVAWRAIPVLAELTPGKEVGLATGYNLTKLPGSWSPDFRVLDSGDPDFSDDFRTIVGGKTRTNWRLRFLDLVGLAYPATLVWTRFAEGEEYSLHRALSGVLANSLLLPPGAVGSTLLVESTNTNAFLALSKPGLANPGVYRIAMSSLTGAPVRGDGQLPSKTLVHSFDAAIRCRGACFDPTARHYCFLEPVGDYYANGAARVRLSHYDTLTSTYTAGAIMPAADYYGLSINKWTNFAANTSFLVLCQGEDRIAGLYSYTPFTNALALLLKAPTLALIEGMSLTQTLANGFLASSVDIIQATDTPTSTVTFTGDLTAPPTVAELSYALIPDSTNILITFRVIHSDSDIVTLLPTYDDGSTHTATVTGDTEVFARPSPGTFCSLLWDGSQADPVTAVTFSVFPGASIVIDRVPPIVPPTNDLDDKLSATGLEEAPIADVTAAAGTSDKAGTEIDIVISGVGFSEPNELGDPRVQAVMLKGPVATQVFDSTRFRIVTVDGVDYLNLRGTVALAGVYDAYLLDKDGARVFKISDAVSVG